MLKFSCLSIALLLAGINSSEAGCPVNCGPDMEAEEFTCLPLQLLLIRR